MVFIDNCKNESVYLLINIFQISEKKGNVKALFKVVEDAILLNHLKRGTETRKKYNALTLL